jgi:hypothetical protein
MSEDDEFMDLIAPIETIFHGIVIQDHGAAGVRIVQPDRSFVRFDSVEEARRWVSEKVKAAKERRK